MDREQTVKKLTHNQTVEKISRASYASLSKIAVKAREEGRFVVILAKDREEVSKYQAFTQLFSPLSSQVKSDVHKTDNTKAREAEEHRKKSWLCLNSYHFRGLNRQGWAERLGVLYRIQESSGLICTIDNLLAKFPPLDFFENQYIMIKKGDDLNPDLLLEQVLEWGYERVPMVANKGEIARRGDILDIVCPLYNKALRIEFFGDTIDEIRLFDMQTQRSIYSLEEASIFAVHPIKQIAQNTKENKAITIREHFMKLFQKGLITELAQASLFKALERQDFKLMSGLVYENPSILEDWLPKNTLWILPDFQAFEENLSTAYSRFHSALTEDIKETGLDQNVEMSLRSPEEIQKSLENQARIFSQDLLIGIEQEEIVLQERILRTFKDLFSHTENLELNRPWQQVVNGLKDWQKKYKQVILSFNTVRGRDKFLKLAEQDNIFPQLSYQEEVKGMFALIASCPHGTELIWENTLIIPEELLRPETGKTRTIATGAFKGLDSYSELNPEDFLVHRDYGIGKFKGLFRLDIGNVSNDYLLMEYADEAKLYLPVDRLSLIQRFKGDGVPSLDRLGSNLWSNSKEKAKKAIEAIAADLVEMYALRKVSKGFNYSPIGELYREFEASFSFEETPDQAKAIQDVLNDMEKATPMDRLVCGDVGFGKTEVALRAAFRAAVDGRQVALLCPTTILAEQHFQNFRARLSGFAINVGLLSRFVSKAKQTETLKLAAKGQIDVLIGTHRLLSADVQLPNLGLMILDEEQRFGVRHKEKLKQFKKNVDSLTLTATPIPRTLQLSMSGIRELSVIETAPSERKPVMTALLNRDKESLKNIINRELEREGQVFWIYNRVQGLEKVVEYVQSLVPHARVGMAHGQLAEKQLENTMNKFWHGELDVLVCTSIVESGLDFPRANTLIVDQAHMFGLGQLYQLRGRVGRSDRQAYAYFVVTNTENLTPLAKERMRIILELDYLGAGFQLAMEDLRLRGAGNILGEVQSGHMSRLGLDLYLEMLEEAVSKLKGDELIRTETELNIGIVAHIPENYIVDTKERLKYYKILSSAPTAELRQEVELEIRDRFGTLPNELNVFLAILDLKELASELHVLKADIFAENIRLTWSEKAPNLKQEKLVSPEAIFSLVSKNQKSMKILPPASLDIKLNPKLEKDKALAEIKELLLPLKPIEN